MGLEKFLNAFTMLKKKKEKISLWLNIYLGLGLDNKQI